METTAQQTPSNNIPADATLADESLRLMLLLVGEPWTGKTWAASTFPDPIFLDFDHKAKPGTITIPFWDAAFCDKYAPRFNNNAPANKRDALLFYLGRQIGKQLPAKATLIIDSGTSVEAAFHHQTEKVEPIPIGKGGKPDGFFVWNQKMRYFPALFELIKTHTGHVIYIMHEQAEKNEEGLPTGRIKPLMSGSFADQIAAHFTAMFRQRIRIGTNNEKEYIWDVVPTKAFNSNSVFADKLKSPTLKAEYASIAHCFPNY